MNPMRKTKTSSTMNTQRVIPPDKMLKIIDMKYDRVNFVFNFQRCDGRNLCYHANKQPPHLIKSFIEGILNEIGRWSQVTGHGLCRIHYAT